MDAIRDWLGQPASTYTILTALATVLAMGFCAINCPSDSEQMGSQLKTTYNVAGIKKRHRFGDNYKRDFSMPKSLNLADYPKI